MSRAKFPFKIQRFHLIGISLVSMLLGGLTPPALTVADDLFPQKLAKLSAVSPVGTSLSASPLSPLVAKAAANLSRVSLLVDLSDYRVYLYRYNTVEASYPIAIGKPGWETPTGTFKVDHLDTNPAWIEPITGEIIPPGADNPLGERWIGFWSDGVYQIGFHGTPHKWAIGHAVSHGCLRMRNEDIRQLYEQVSLETKVVVRE
jgi:hypothetical protein